MMEVVMDKTKIENYPAYKDSGAEWLGEIPEHWDSIRMKHLFRDVSVKNNPEAVLLSVTQNKGVVPRTWVENRMVMPSGALESFKLIHKGDFAISLRSFEGGLEYCHHDGIISPAYTVLKAQRNFENDFYKYLFKSFSFISELQTSVVGIREGKNISFQQLSYSFLPVPSFKEQSAIAAFLDRKTVLLDQAIGIKQKQIELLKERRQILIHKAVTRGLNPNVKLKDSGVVWIGEIPEDWQISALSYLARIDTGSTPDRTRPNYWNGSIPWVKTGEIRYDLISETEEYITESGLKNSATRLAPKGTILMAMYGQGVTRGRVAILGVKAAYNQACCAILFNEKINNIYGYYFFVAAYPHVRDAGNETSQMNLSSGYISKLKMPIPPKAEQIIISEYINATSQKIATSISLKEQEIEKLKEYKVSLINSAVTGKIKVS